MKKLLNQINFSYTIYIVLSLFFFYSCEKEDIGNLSQKELHHSFSLHKFSDEFIKKNLIVNWGAYDVEVDSSIDRGKYLYSTSLKVPSALYSNEQKWGQMYKLLAEKDSLSNWNYTLLEFLSVKDSILPSNLSTSNTVSFTGTLYFYDLEGNTKKIESYEDGVKMTEFMDKEHGKVTLQSKAPKVCGDYNPFCEDGKTVTYIAVSVSTYTDHYNVREGGKLDYSYSTYDGTKTKWVAVPVNDPEPKIGSYVHHHVDDPNLNHGSGSSGSNHPKDVILDDSFKNTKADCAFQKLKKQNGDLFKTTIGKFIDDPKYDLIFTVGNCEYTNIGCTDGNEVGENGDITIILEDVYQPTLEIAASILHEGIHAEIYRYVDEHTDNPVDPKNRTRLMELYSHYIGIAENTDYNITYPVTMAQHEYMAENYVKPIAEAIRSLDGNKYPLEYYMWYGWEGLERSYNFNSRLSSSDKTKYNNYQEIVNNNTDVKCN